MESMSILLPVLCGGGLLLTAHGQPAFPAGTNQNDLTMNFVNAPIHAVLDYLSDSAGLIVVQETPVTGNVTVTGKHLTQAEAVDLLNGELNRHNCTAVRGGRLLTIMSKNEGKTSAIPVMTGNDPAGIPDDNRIATWIIPVRFIEARQLASDLSAYVSPEATMVANEAGNAMVVTDTQTHIRRLATIIQAVDNSAESETEIRVFPLKHASPVDVAGDLSGVFPSSSSSGSQVPVEFGAGPGGGPDGGPGGGPPDGGPGFPSGEAATAAGSSQQRLQKAAQVNAVADSRIQAVIVTAPKHLMAKISSLVTALDVPSNRDQNVYVFRLQNADPQQLAQVLQNVFGSGSTASSGTGSSQNSPLMQRALNNTASMSSTATASMAKGLTSGTGGSAGAGNSQP